MDEVELVLPIPNKGNSDANDTINDTINVLINANVLSEVMTVKRDLYVLRDMNLAKYVGSNNTGHWEVNN